MLISTCSQTFKSVRLFRYLGEPLGQLITLRGPFFGKQEIGDER